MAQSSPVANAAWANRVPLRISRRLPIGAEVQPDGGVHFRVSAPSRKTVEVALRRPTADGDARPESTESSLNLKREPDGYFSGFTADSAAGDRYGFRLDDEEKVYPDPASRFQPDGPHGLSQVVDPSRFPWRDNGWQGPSRKGQINYELHIGTFTPEGTFAAAIAKLPLLGELGITLLELMPVAEFDGRFGWGYDGVDLFAPTRLYGEPDSFRRFVDEAHRLGLGVILDVVYNHFGPTGNYLAQFSNHYTSRKHKTDWGEAINFDAEDNCPVREFFTTNAGYWIDEFHIDGLRLDAIHAIVDDSSDHIVAAITRRVREAAGGRKALVVVENERQQPHVLRDTTDGGCCVDAAWNDDFHHAARVAMT
ncbi:MAG TPA: alpha-amylase family glycosyl hydrolase, partial [Pirellulales bacterium]